MMYPLEKHGNTVLKSMTYSMSFNFESIAMIGIVLLEHFQDTFVWHSLHSIDFYINFCQTHFPTTKVV